jgi:hypothetical protein
MRGRAMRMMAVMAMVAALAIPVAAGVVEVTIEDFDNVTAGGYNAYGGADLGEVATLSGWEIGGRYITITDRDSLGDMDATGNNGNGSTCVATAISISGSHGTPVYEAADALDMSASTYVKIGLAKYTAGESRWGTNGAVRMYYRDATDSLDKYANIATGWGVPSHRYQGDQWLHTTLLSSLTAFDKTEDLVYGFWMNPNGAYAGSGEDPYPTWEFITYDVEILPVAEPAGLGFIGLALLGLSKRQRRA